MLQQNPKYKHVSDVLTKFDIRLVHSTTGPFHWFILIQMLGSDLPFLTIEITTSNLTDLIPVMRTTDLKEAGGRDKQPLTKVGIYHGTIRSIYKFADAVVVEMGGYNLLVNNCQHFCNNLLERLNLRTYDTTIGPKTTLRYEEKKVDHITTVLGQVYDAGAPAGTGRMAAVDAPPPMSRVTKHQSYNTIAIIILLMAMIFVMYELLYYMT
jgi:hypothetical protein